VNDRYLDFLAARHELLANAANDFLIELRDGATQAVEPLQRIVVLGEEELDDRAQQVQSLVAELSEMGRAQPQIDRRSRIRAAAASRPSRKRSGPTGCKPAWGNRSCWNSTPAASCHRWPNSATRSSHPSRRCDASCCDAMQRTRSRDPDLV
jgi:hypothetical protein